MCEISIEGSDLVKLSPEALAMIEGVKAQMHSSIGQVVLAMSSVPRYRNHSLADLAHLVIDPLVRDCISIASAKPIEDADPETALAPAAIAIWASVSDQVDKKIKEQIEAGAFPVRLKVMDWKSGDRVWLLDIIAPNRDLATAMLVSFKQIAKAQPLNIHPIVAGLVDPEILEILMQADSAQEDPPLSALN
ncbi:ACP:hemolysin acyltransferase (hemolysin-activating protein) [Hoeflea phototrophica DFL-43]|uniref:RTX toxin-activating lysine-acyltransferase n=1 Tax=Hoeflea phototrophica (strain DSM 17068 / NCIMB 14078 / DFL-43) TaxID=411684 RepID=A9CZL5_HOEPD|nr:toxin-activating lysine-acyltransferase [Hoeflea phototrophica]EDQ34791.2 ACP:hemolysin acyltransferase (hemolysin-activating protein) [Hoeflea phototrophica DFL-43]